MFKVGDRVVCVDDTPIYDNNFNHNMTKFLKINNIYLIYKYSSNLELIKIVEYHIWYDEKRFILLKEQRKQKLKELICLK